MTDVEEDSITWTMSEFGEFQNEMLNLKHENLKLKTNSERYEELAKLAANPYFEIINLRKAVEEKTQALNKLKDESSKPKFPAFSRQTALECLKKVRKEEILPDDQELLLEQLLAIFEHMWPKGGQSDSQRLSEHTLDEITNKADVKRYADVNSKLKLNLETLEQKSKAIETALDSTAKENNDLLLRVQELEAQKETLIIDLATREEEVNDARQALKEKYAVECSRQELDLENNKLKRTLERLEQEIKELRGSGAITLKEEIKALDKDNQELKKALDDIRGSEHLLQLEYKNLKTSAKETMHELAALTARNKELESQLKILEEQNKKLHLDYEDAKTEKQIIQKRSMHDVKDLKAQYAKEKTMHDHCKLEKDRLAHELKIAQDTLKTAPRSSMAAPTYKEKVFVEALSQRVQELEQEIFDNQSKMDEYKEICLALTQAENENEELKLEINKLQTDIGMLGAQFNEMMRSKGTN